MIKIQEDISRSDYTIEQGRNGEYYIYYKDEDKPIAVLDENEYGKIDDEIDEDIKGREQKNLKSKWYVTIMSQNGKKYPVDPPDTNPLTAKFIYKNGNTKVIEYDEAESMTKAEMKRAVKIHNNKYPDKIEAVFQCDTDR